MRVGEELVDEYEKSLEFASTQDSNANVRRVHSSILSLHFMNICYKV